MSHLDHDHGDLPPAKARRLAGLPEKDVKRVTVSVEGQNVNLASVVRLDDLALPHGALIRLAETMMKALRDERISEIVVVGMTNSLETTLRHASADLKRQGKRLRIAPVDVEGRSAGFDHRYISIVQKGSAAVERSAWDHTLDLTERFK